METTKSRNLPLSKRGFNFETTMWAFTRFTVIAMYGLILAGIIGGLIVSIHGWKQVHGRLKHLLRRLYGDDLHITRWSQHDRTKYQ
jgi:hypothetical protein